MNDSGVSRMKMYFWLRAKEGRYEGLAMWRNLKQGGGEENDT